MNIVKALLDLVYPQLCVYCKNTLVKSETILCSHCLVQLPKTNFHLDPENPMTAALWGRFKIEFATSFLFFKKGGLVQTLLHQLKYKGNQEIGLLLGKLFAKEIEDLDFVKSIHYLVPVPLHKNKMKQRGYNQSKVICEGLSDILKIPIREVLSREQYTATQTHKKRFERWKNVSEKFVISNPQILSNKTILLVDDVFTTGATIEACCLSLNNCENLKIGITALAMAEN